MHPTILVKRKADAINRILAKADALATHLELDPALIEALQPKGIRDSQVLEMMRLEALANLLDKLATMAGVSVETAASEGNSEPPEDVVSGPSPIDETLPPPVLEEDASIASQGEVAVPTEEPPVEEAPKKSARGKRSRK